MRAVRTGHEIKQDGNMEQCFKREQREAGECGAVGAKDFREESKREKTGQGTEVFQGA